MLKKLKECKTIKEIFEVTGFEIYQKITLIILCGWAIMPIIAALTYIALYLKDRFSFYPIVWDCYKNIFLAVGAVTVVFAIWILIGQISVSGKEYVRKKVLKPWNALLLAMLLWSVISTAFSDDVFTSILGTDYRNDGLLSYFVYAAVYITASFALNEKIKKRFFDTMIAAGSIVSIIVILQDSVKGILNDIFIFTLGGVFFQFNHTGYYMNVIITICIGMYLFETDRSIFRRLLYILSLALNVYGILVNSTLGAFLGSILGLIVLCVFYLIRAEKGTKKRILVPIAVFALVTLLSYYGFVPTSTGQDMKVNIDTITSDITNIAAGQGENAGHGRMTLWMTGLKMIPKRPIFGYGPEMQDEELTATIWNDRIDNEVLQYAIFLGIPGAVFYVLALLLLGINRCVNLKKLKYSTLIAGGVVVAYLLSSMLGNTMFYTVCYFWLALGLVNSDPCAENPDSPKN